MNKVYAIIGPPASGKTSIVKQLLKQHGIPALVSHTTRAPKDGEQNGVDYYFIDKLEFTKIHFVEKVSYSGHYYGLSKDEVLKKVALQPFSVVDISITGFEQLKMMLGERLQSIYVLVDKETIINRYLEQGASNEDIKQKIEYAESNGEFNNWQIADHVVKNTGPLEVTLRQVLAIMDLIIPRELNADII